MFHRIAALAVLLSFVAVASAQLPETRPMIAKSESNHGAISIRKLDGKFSPQRAKANLPAEELMVLLPGSAITNNSGSVGMVVVADYDGLAPTPVLETAIKLHDSNRYDLSLTIERGRLDFENRSKKGPVIIELKFANQKWLMTLDKFAARATIEVASRWAPGSRFQGTPKPGHEPTVQANLIVWRGSAEVDTAQVTMAMSAPPGPAQLRWMSIGTPPSLSRLEKLPPWADPNNTLTPLTVQSRSAVEQFRELWMVRPEAAFETLLRSSRFADRRVGLVAAGAFDQLGVLAESITSANEVDVWDFGITVVRHWLGRGVAQEQQLYKFLLEQREFTPAHADTLIALLNGFSPAELARPETYEVLVEYLQHDRPTIRNLAAWHLVRLVPSGKNIPFKPNSSKEQFRQTYNRWRELVPAGKLPSGVK
jgi:hypothetical protein